VEARAEREARSAETLAGDLDQGGASEMDDVMCTVCGEDATEGNQNTRSCFAMDTSVHRRCISGACLCRWTGIPRGNWFCPSCAEKCQTPPDLILQHRRKWRRVGAWARKVCKSRRCVRPLSYTNSLAARWYAPARLSRRGIASHRSRPHCRVKSDGGCAQYKIE